MTNDPEVAVAEGSGSRPSTIRGIVSGHPDGISRFGLLGLARLRISPDFSDAQLEASLTALGPAVRVEGDFIRGTDQLAYAEARPSDGDEAVAR